MDFTVFCGIIKKKSEGGDRQGHLYLSLYDKLACLGIGFNIIGVRNKEKRARFRSMVLDEDPVDVEVKDVEAKSAKTGAKSSVKSSQGVKRKLKFDDEEFDDEPSAAVEPPQKKKKVEGSA